jgi:hypothetical protein
MRANVAKFQKALEDLEDNQSKAYESVFELKTELAEIRDAMTKNETEDSALQTAEQMSMLLSDDLGTVTWVVFGNTRDKLKDWKKRVVPWMKNPTELTPQQWDEVDEMEKALRSDKKIVEGSWPAVERAYKKVEAVAKRYNSEAIQDFWKKAQTAYQEKKDARDEFTKDAELINKSLNSLLNIRP